MRTANLVAMALIAAAVVIAGFAARHAAMAEESLVWLDGLAQPLREIQIHRRRDGYVEEAGRFAGVDGAIGVLLLPGRPLPATRTLVVRDRDAFSREVARRFGEDARRFEAAALAPQGRLRKGFVARVAVADKVCDFAIAGYAEGGTEIVAVARAVVCEPADHLTPPDVRLAGLLAAAETSR